MKNHYKIGKGSENDIVVRGEECPLLHAEIKYERGYWILINTAEGKPIYVNEKIVLTSIKLSKYDKIKLCNQTIYWSDYLYEGERQELTAKDIISYHGRISRSNFRALSILTIGLSVCIFFLPGFLIAIWEYLNRRKFRNVEFDTIETIHQIAPVIYIIGFGLLALLFLLLGIKRVRDTGNPIWKLFLPIYNLKLLYFDESKK